MLGLPGDPHGQPPQQEEVPLRPSGKQGKSCVPNDKLPCVIIIVTIVFVMAIALRLLMIIFTLVDRLVDLSVSLS